MLKGAHYSEHRNKCALIRMMESTELQEEEREVLLSIYESDDSFKQVNNTTYTYRVGDRGSPKSFLLQIVWGDNYPGTLPDISLDVFYNNHLNEESKKTVLGALAQEAEGMMDTPMTYSLFEFAKENGSDWVTVSTASVAEPPAASAAQPVKVKKEKKEVLSKAAKRRMADRLNAEGELPRGWNWVDIIKHLSKTGSPSN